MPSVKCIARFIIGLTLLPFVAVHAQAVSPLPETVRFAVIGDYGSAGAGSAAVSAMVHGWQPDFIVTTGDNNYPSGAAATIDANIGRYYHDFIHPYTGEYGQGADENRFFPVLGNHDWETANAQPYLDYFTLPGNERYYDFVQGAVHIFALDANFSEPDGIRANSIQATWLEESMRASDARWQLVFMHISPYSSGHHGSFPIVQWDYAAWGADAVLSGHDHSYERLIVDDLVYFVNGAGGAGLYNFETTVEGSQFRSNRSYGAMLVTATETEIRFEFYSVWQGGTLIDSYTLSAGA